MGPKRFEETANGQHHQSVHQHCYTYLASDGEHLEYVKFMHNPDRKDLGEIVVKSQQSNVCFYSK